METASKHTGFGWGEQRGRVPAKGRPQSCVQPPSRPRQVTVEHRKRPSQPNVPAELTGSGKWEWSPVGNSSQGTSLLYHHYSEDLKALSGTAHKPITIVVLELGSWTLPPKRAPSSFKVPREHGKGKIPKAKGMYVCQAP